MRFLSGNLRAPYPSNVCTNNSKQSNALGCCGSHSTSECMAALSRTDKAQCHGLRRCLADLSGKNEPPHQIRKFIYNTIFCDVAVTDAQQFALFSKNSYDGCVPKSRINRTIPLVKCRFSWPTPRFVTPRFVDTHWMASSILVTYTSKNANTSTSNTH